MHNHKPHHKREIKPIVKVQALDLVARTVKTLPANAGNWGSNPGLGRSPGEGNGYPLQYTGLENSMDLYSLWDLEESDGTEELSLID